MAADVQEDGRSITPIPLRMTIEFGTIQTRNFLHRPLQGGGSDLAAPALDGRRR